MSLWTDHVERWKDCTKCPLAQQRSLICIARGQVPCDVVFIGEAPGPSEDALGLPFKGPAGNLLDQIIERALPSDVRYALTNLVCCFPRDAKTAGDNEPEHDEILACRPRLVEFVRLAMPRLVVLVGALARRYVSGASMFRTDGRSEQPEWVAEGRFLEFCEIVHPAAILRMPLAQKNYAVQKNIVVLRRAVLAVMDPQSKHNPSHRDPFVTTEDEIPF